MNEPGSELRIDLSDFGLSKAGASAADGSMAGGSTGGMSEPGAHGARGGVGWSAGRRIRLLLVLAPPAVLLPFLLLLRGSVHAHAVWGLGPWPAVLTGIFFATLTLGGLLWAALALVGFPRGFRSLLPRAVAVLAMVFVIHGMLHVGVRNVKGDAVRAEYRALHPLLRLGSTVLVLVDRDAVLTDAARRPEDYGAMGLSPARSSLHYPQDDGYVHALDLRTVGRPEWRNVLLEMGYRVMGFDTLRHEGTADHLHVSLPLRGDGSS
jgi:hypothetical protein